jgi:hypothetical protein
MSTLQKKIGIGFLLLFIFSTSFSQINPEDEKELAAIRTELEILSKKIEDAFNKNPKNLDVMQSRLKQINAITDTAKLRLAVEDYRSTYLTAYGDMVKAAGVDMNEFVKLMTTKFPNYTFSVQNNYGIGFKKNTSKGTAKSGTAAATPTTTTTAITGFLQAKDAGCALGAGSEITFPTRSVKASSTAAVVGGCNARGELTKDLTLPSTAISIHLRLTWTQKIRAYAVGIVGLASGYASCFSAAGVENEGALISEYVSDMAFAPLLWVANFDKEFPFDKTIDLTASKGKTLTIVFSAYSSSVAGVCCATNATGQIIYSRANLVVTK